VDLAEPPLFVLCDPIQISQVLLNLFQNALEALEAIPAAGRQIVVAVTATAGILRMSVSDTGIGLPEGAKDRIFDTFFTTKQGGLGLGLTISKSLLEAHGGRLMAGENLPRGATFAIELPLIYGA
jgi:signal transduction histidine kinase